MSRFRPDGQRAELAPSRAREEAKLLVDGDLTRINHPPGASCACLAIRARPVQFHPAVPVRPAERPTLRTRHAVASASGGPAYPTRADPAALPGQLHPARGRLRRGDRHGLPLRGGDRRDACGTRPGPCRRHPDSGMQSVRDPRWPIDRRRGRDASTSLCRSCTTGRYRRPVQRSHRATSR